VIYTHPNNLKLLKDATLPDDVTIVAKASKEIYPSDLFAGEKVQTNKYLPERRVIEKWHPPPSERFIEYEYSDEEWLRPLWIGLVEQIDDGPLFYYVNEKLLYNDFLRMPLAKFLWEPSVLYLNTT